MSRTAGPLVLCLVSLPGLLLAQSRDTMPARVREGSYVAMDAGMTAVRWTDASAVAVEASPRQSGVTISPSLHWGGTQWSLDGAGSWTSDPLGGGVLQGSAQGAVFSPTLGRVYGEAYANGNASRLGNGFTSTRAMAGSRVHVPWQHAGVWVGVGTGLAGHDIQRRRTTLGESGAYATRGAATLLLMAGHHVVRDATGSASRDRYTDIETAVRVNLPRVELGLSIGHRAAPSRGVSVLGGARTWGTAAATWWLTHAAALTASAGNYAADVGLGFPGGQYASVGVRLTRWQRTSRRAPAMVARDVAPEFTVRTLAGSDSMELSFRLVGATRADVAGDFTNWTPRQLQRANDHTWRIRIPRLSDGTHQIAVRADGGTWRAPDGLPAMRDEFGGEAGLLVIERR